MRPEVAETSVTGAWGQFRSRGARSRTGSLIGGRWCERAQEAGGPGGAGVDVGVGAGVDVVLGVGVEVVVDVELDAAEVVVVSGCEAVVDELVAEGAWSIPNSPIANWVSVVLTVTLAIGVALDVV